MIANESLLPGTNYSEEIQNYFYSYAEPYVASFASHSSRAVGAATADFVGPAISSTIQENAERFVKEVGEQLVKEAIWRIVETGAKGLATRKGVAGTIGKVTSRFIPYVGWVLLAKDIYDLQDFVRDELS
jgi:hypothetical protein